MQEGAEKHIESLLLSTRCMEHHMCTFAAPVAVAATLTGHLLPPQPFTNTWPDTGVHRNNDAMLIIT
jgi:hypothetical protein